MTYEEARQGYSSAEEMARVLFELLRLQEAKLKQHAPKYAIQANNKRRENR